MTTDRPPIRPDGFPDRPQPRKTNKARVSKGPKRSFVPPEPPSTSQQWVWILGIILMISVSLNFWQAGQIAGLKSQTPVHTVTTQTAMADADTADTGLIDVAGNAEGNQTKSKEDFLRQMPRSEPTLSGNPMLEDPSPPPVSQPMEPRSRTRMEISFSDEPDPALTTPLTVNSYLFALDKALNDPNQGLYDYEEIMGMMADFQDGNPDLWTALDPAIGLQKARIEAVQGITPPPSCQPTLPDICRDYHSALVAELSQGVKLLEAMLQFKTRSYTEDAEVRSAMDLKYNVLDGFRRESNRTLLLMNPQ